MVFSSLFFLFVFLTVVCGVYLLLPSIKARNILLLCASLIFYAWAGPVYVGLLCAMTFICWVGALALSRSDETARYRRVYLWATIGACIALLCLFKYTDFLVWNVQSIFGLEPDLPGVVLPIGISFYTFQLISYVVDVYRGETEAQGNYFRLLLYAALFFQCVAGPIVRYKDVSGQLEDRRAGLDDVFAGLTRFTVGLGKKAILTNACAVVADTLLPLDGTGFGSLTSLSVLIGMAAYMMQIYLDFSAYSDMAIGMGRMMGFRFRENFNYPYAADSVTDFWRRWHISLSTFFRDYVYIPLGGSRNGVVRQILSLLCVWGLTGLWHGASWNFVLWGLYFAALLMLEKFVFKWQPGGCTGWKLGLRRAYTVVVVFFGWFLFRFEDLSMLGQALAALFGVNGFADKLAATTLLNNLFILIACAAACTPVIPWVRDKLTAVKDGSGSGAKAASVIGNCAAIAVPVLMLVLSALALIGNTYNPFLYTRF